MVVHLRISRQTTQIHPRRHQNRIHQVQQIHQVATPVVKIRQRILLLHLFKLRIQQTRYHKNQTRLPLPN
jgi:hypothetical protein